jgi:flagellar motor protein MotB
MSMNQPARHYAIFIAVLLLAACTDMQKKYEETEQALKSCQQLRMQEQGEWLKKNDQLGKNLAKCRLTAHEIISDSRAARARETELRQLLSRELSEHNVELEYLKGRLTIRMLDRVLFEPGSARILPAGKSVLDKLALAISKTRDLIRVASHTDDIRVSTAQPGSYPSNWELSAARASSVVRYFQENHGIDPMRMEAVGLSKYRPVTENTDNAARQRNRRVEIILTAREG